MGVFKDFLDNIFSDKNGIKLSSNEYCLNLEQRIWYTKYAQHIVAERYGALLSKCEVKTYIKGKEKKGDNYYLLNVSPNPNQTSSEFWKQVANKLICELECLIIITDNGNWYVADSFKKGSYQLEETNFTDVSVNLYGDDVESYNLTGTFSGNKCIYLKYSNKSAMALQKQMVGLYSELISNVSKAGSSKLKYALNINTTALNGVDIDFNEEIKRIVNQDFDKLVSENNTIIPLFDGFKLEVLNPSNNNAQNATTASQNINSMFEDIMNNVAQIYNVPTSIMNGKYEEDDMDDFLTFGLDPIAKLIEKGINRKFYGKRSYLDNSKVVVNTKGVKHFDILSIANAINKVISSGAYTINELRRLLEEDPIDSSIGDVHWITRNYAVVGDYIQEQSNFTGNDKKTHPEQYEE